MTYNVCCARLNCLTQNHYSAQFRQTTFSVVSDGQEYALGLIVAFIQICQYLFPFPKKHLFHILQSYSPQ